MRLVLITIAIAVSLVSANGTALLQKVSWTETLDTVVVQLQFAGDLPEKYRVSLVRDSSGQNSVLMAFLGADLGELEYQGGDKPKWFLVQAKPEAGRSVIRALVAVERDVAFRGEWKGSMFQLTFPNAMKKTTPLWKNPWVYVGIGAATIGGAVLWMSTGKTTTTKTDEIAPPDVTLPE